MGKNTQTQNRQLSADTLATQTLRVPMLKGDKPGELSSADAADTFAGCTVGYLQKLGVDYQFSDNAFSDLQTALNALIDLVSTETGLPLTKVSVLPTRAMHKDAISLTASVAAQLDSLDLSLELQNVLAYWTAWFWAELACHCPDSVKATWKLEVR